MKKTKSLKIAICQINPTVGDLGGNRGKIVETYFKAVRDHLPDLVVFPECALTGYPPEDLLHKPVFLFKAQKALDYLCKDIGRTPVIVGTVFWQKDQVYNSAVGIKDKKIQWKYHKKILPNYGVFDEKRYFTPGKESGLFHVEGIKIGISVCEDIWEENKKLSPPVDQAKRGAKLLINISASPFYSNKFKKRSQMLQRRARATRKPIIYVNCVGGQDELVYDGRSMALDREGNIQVLAKSFEEDIRVVQLDLAKGQVKSIQGEKAALNLGISEIYQSLILGIRDYVNKNRFKTAILGLSGGIDSAVVAALAVAAIGKDRVIGVTMPSKFSSKSTRNDAEILAKNLNIQFLTIPINRIFKSYLDELAPFFKSHVTDVAEENLQPRIRAALLMALSNRYGHLVLNTGNKSELAVGYCTLYGDMAGGFAVLKDATKGIVYDLARHINKMAGHTVIPKSTISRAPSAELKFDQKDQDTLPPYPLLDKILDGYVEEDLSFTELVKKGLDKTYTQKVIRMVDANEYKRRQSPPGIKITAKAFGRDRRMPITNRFSELD